MKNKMYWVLIFLFMSCFVHADTLEFKNGDRLTGKILNEESGKIFVPKMAHGALREAVF